LPKFEGSYVYTIVGKPKFEASVNGNQLKVLSKNETDEGKHKLDLVAQIES